VAAKKNVKECSKKKGGKKEQRGTKYTWLGCDAILFGVCIGVSRVTHCGNIIIKFLLKNIQM